MAVVIDMVGRRCGRLIVEKFAYRRGRREYFWKCRCDCGAEKIVRGMHLRNGKTKSCGCVHGVRISNPVTHEQLRTILRYVPATGNFYWKITSRKYKMGDRAGIYNTGTGYIQFSLNKQLYNGHVLAWFYMTGCWPSSIDHRDVNRTNNKWSNLRLATQAQNMGNISKSKLNTSGYKGVARTGTAGRFRAYVRGKHLGVFGTAIEAARAYDEGARKVFGEFARTNFGME